MSIYINHVKIPLQNNSKTRHFRNFLQDFFRETPFLKLDLLYNHVINITPWLEPIFFPLETNLTLEMVTDLLWVFE